MIGVGDSKLRCMRGLELPELIGPVTSPNVKLLIEELGEAGAQKAETIRKRLDALAGNWRYVRFAVGKARKINLYLAVYSRAVNRAVLAASEPLDLRADNAQLAAQQFTADVQLRPCMAYTLDIVTNGGSAAACLGEAERAVGAAVRLLQGRLRLLLEVDLARYLEQDRDVLLEPCSQAQPLQRHGLRVVRAGWRRLRGLGLWLRRQRVGGGSPGSVCP